MLTSRVLAGIVRRGARPAVRSLATVDEAARQLKFMNPAMTDEAALEGAKEAESMGLLHLFNEKITSQGQGGQEAAANKWRSNAEELISKVPVIEVDGDMVCCDGGGGALGHPLEYIQLNTVVPGSVVTCKYCGLRYKKKLA